MKTPKTEGVSPMWIIMGISAMVLGYSGTGIIRELIQEEEPEEVIQARKLVETVLDSKDVCHCRAGGDLSLCFLETEEIDGRSFLKIRIADQTGTPRPLKGETLPYQVNCYRRGE